MITLKQLLINFTVHGTPCFRATYLSVWVKCDYVWPLYYVVYKHRSFQPITVLRLRKKTFRNKLVLICESCFRVKNFRKLSRHTQNFLSKVIFESNFRKKVSSVSWPYDPLFIVWQMDTKRCWNWHGPIMGQSPSMNS